jgi:hypothetical protein
MLNRRWLWMVGMVACCVAAQAGEPGVDRTVEGIIARMRSALGREGLLKLDAATVDLHVTAADRAVLASRYWRFTANVPVLVSVMRAVEQKVPPFWLQSRGFARTGLRVRNEEYEYEVWQKSFPAGEVGLGINGFDQHRPHYFVSVGPLKPGSALRLSGYYPRDQHRFVMQKGSPIYHDWPDLVISELPDALKGQVLLTTIRGRAREAHLVGGFRTTSHPSGPKPDQLHLTWAADPATSIAVQWRTAPSVRAGRLQWRPAGSASAWRMARASSDTLTDSRIVNDPVVRAWRAVLRGLRPGTAYEYRVEGSAATHRFRTAPAGPAPLTFTWLSDTHNQPATASLLAAALRRFPQQSFCTISGDLVGTGQNRDDWDQFWRHLAAYAPERPVVPSMGNHDAIDGLGPDGYLAQFALPANGAPSLRPGRSYHFEHSGLLFMALDATDVVSAQTAWLAETLRKSKARWKVAAFHFPPYSLEEDYPEIRRQWCPLFDRYGVDLVLSGHVHRLQRTYPIRANRALPEGSAAPVYLMTVAVGQRGEEAKRPRYALVNLEPGVPIYHAFELRGSRLTMQALDADGKEWDRLEIAKPAGR